MTTVKLVAEPTTWALVTMSPLLSITIPEPRPSAVSISTTDGMTRPTSRRKFIVTRLDKESALMYRVE